MVHAITQGVKVSVETEYQPDYSSPIQMHYVFTYRVMIENHSPHTIQLKTRHWYVHDAATRAKEVEGPGVIGQQPILEPGEVHEYVSGCNLKSGLGRMHGSYTMERQFDGKQFEVSIPEFQLMAPFRKN